jgi:Fe-S-cluster containining protein
VGTKRPLPIVGQLGDASISEAARRGTQAMLREGVGAVEMADQAFAWYEEVVALAKERTPPSRAFACASGCTYCCHLKVTITPLEALRLGAYLRKKLSGAELGRLKKRVSEAVKQTRDTTAYQRAAMRMPCVLLDPEGRCIAYEARPAGCAGANSYDAEQCRTAHLSDDDLPIDHYGLQRSIASAVAAGVTNAIADTAHDPRILELFKALRVVLDDPDAKSKWQRGLPVFETAVDREFAKRLLA